MRRLIIGALIIGAGIFCAWYIYLQPQDTKMVSFDNYRVKTLVADSPTELAKGLSGSDQLKENEGMLFIFPSDAYYGFWMKDMNYSIDIIWLNNGKQIVDIKADAQPSSYPESFGPRDPARYVVELRAGMVAKHRLEIGDQATF